MSITALGQIIEAAIKEVENVRKEVDWDLEAKIDELSVQQFAEFMKNKLWDSRQNKGRHGWWDSVSTPKPNLRTLLAEHILKDVDQDELSNYIDIANLCMMCYFRKIPADQLRKLLTTLIVTGM